MHATGISHGLCSLCSAHNNHWTTSCSWKAPKRNMQARDLWTVTAHSAQPMQLAKCTCPVLHVVCVRTYTVTETHRQLASNASPIFLQWHKSSIHLSSFLSRNFPSFLHDKVSVVLYNVAFLACTEIVVNYFFLHTRRRISLVKQATWRIACLVVSICSLLAVLMWPWRTMAHSGVYIVQGEVALVLAAMKKGSRWRQVRSRRIAKE